MRRDSALYDRLAASVAPNVHGHTDVKRAILLMLLGGVHKQTREVRAQLTLHAGQWRGAPADRAASRCALQAAKRLVVERHMAVHTCAQTTNLRFPLCRASICAATSTWQSWATLPAPSRKCSSEDAGSTFESARAVRNKYVGRRSPRLIPWRRSHQAACPPAHSR